MCTQEVLNKIAQELKSEALLLFPNVHKIILYGSYARGDMTSFLTRPISLIFILIAIYSVVGPIITKAIKSRKAAKSV